MKRFEEPSIEIEKFQILDVITTSEEIPEETQEPGGNWGGGRV